MNWPSYIMQRCVVRCLAAVRGRVTVGRVRSGFGFSGLLHTHLLIYYLCNSSFQPWSLFMFCLFFAFRYFLILQHVSKICFQNVCRELFIWSIHSAGQPKNYIQRILTGLLTRLRPHSVNWNILNRREWEPAGMQACSLWLGIRLRYC